MNIAMVQSTPFPPEEGIGNYVSNLSRELVDRGHSVSVLTRGGLRREQAQEGEITVVRLPYLPAYPFHVDLHGLAVNRFLDRAADRLDLVHAHTPLTPVIDAPVPLCSTVHTSIVEDVGHVHGWNVTNLASRLTLAVSSKRLLAGQSAAADRVTTVSERVARELADHYGIDATVVGNGVDAERFRPGQDSDDRRYVLYVGRLDFPKGLPDLLEAAERVVEDHGLEFVIAGKGPLRARLERLADRRGIGDHVTFAGYVSRAHQLKLYQNATAFVLPSHYEGLPTVLLEAMACGAPAIATMVGGCPEVIDDGVNGVLVPPGDPEALADAIGAVLDDGRWRARLGTNARRTVLDRYTWEALADTFEQEYRLAMEAA
jgi:glycosyltransferase involved in cell wall biosynthesis